MATGKNPGYSGPVDVWGDRPTPEHGQCERADIGPLRLWLRGVENEVWIAHEPTSPGDAPEAPSADIEWSRWALRDSPHRLRIRPVFPDRPLVVKLERPFTLLRKAKARVYLRVPAWVCVEAVEESREETALLCEIPTGDLSETWWGDLSAGELSYWLPTFGKRVLSPEFFEPHIVTNTVQLTNLSADDLRVEKLVLRVEHLSIYEKDGWLWAEEVKVRYHGAEEGSEIHMDDEPPEEVRDARELSPARAQVRSFRARTFARLKALSGFAG